MNTYQETACTRCEHQEVCKHKEEFLNAQYAVENASISFQTEETGKATYSQKPISAIDYILPIKLQCKHAVYKPTAITRDMADTAISSVGHLDGKIKG